MAHDVLYHSDIVLRSVGVALFLWDNWYDKVAGRFHVEESCEALLARLVAIMWEHPQRKSLEDCGYLFLILKAASNKQKTPHDSRIQRGLYEYLDTNTTATTPPSLSHLFSPPSPSCIATHTFLPTCSFLPLPCPSPRDRCWPLAKGKLNASQAVGHMIMNGIYSFFFRIARFCAATTVCQYLLMLLMVLHCLMKGLGLPPPLTCPLEQLSRCTTVFLMIAPPRSFPLRPPGDYALGPKPELSATMLVFPLMSTGIWGILGPTQAPHDHIPRRCHGFLAANVHAVHLQRKVILLGGFGVRVIGAVLLIGTFFDDSLLGWI